MGPTNCSAHFFGGYFKFKLNRNYVLQFVLHLGYWLYNSYWLITIKGGELELIISMANW